MTMAATEELKAEKAKDPTPKKLATKVAKKWATKAAKSAWKTTRKAAKSRTSQKTARGLTTKHAIKKAKASAAKALESATKPTKTPGEGEAYVQTVVPQMLARRFKAECAYQGRPQTEVVAELLEAFLAKHEAKRAAAAG